MRFKLITSGSHYTKTEKSKLETLGFEFDETVTGSWGGSSFTKRGKDIEIEIHTIEELLALVKNFGEIIVHEDLLQIYDNYIE